MEWTHTLTIIFSIVGSTYVFYTMIQKDIARHDDELKDMRQEFSKRDALWADLLKQIHEIKLFQVSKE
jgi:hypothetical protein